MEFFETIGDIFQEYQAQYNVFVFGSIHIVAEFIGCSPKGFF
jgi:hypothetical protein